MLIEGRETIEVTYITEKLVMGGYRSFGIQIDIL